MSSLQFPGLKAFRFFFDIRDIETVELDQLPDGWLSTVIELATSKTYKGLRRSLSTPYKFIGNGGFLCRREFYTYLGMARIVLRIEMLQQDLSYANIYTGKLNFNDPGVFDGQSGFVVPSISNDFSNNIDTYDSVNYAFSLQNGINLELTPLALNETATFIPIPLDGTAGSFFYPPFQALNNQQNSIDQTVKSVPEIHFQTLLPANFGQWFFYSRLDQNLLIKGTLQIEKLRFSAGIVRFSIFNDSNVEVYVIAESLDPSDAGVQTIDVNISLHVAKGEKLYFYCYNSLLIEGSAIVIRNGQLNFSYKTITPPTMCKAFTGTQLFGNLLQAMNINYNSIANSPYPFQSFLLSGALANVVFTSQDSIRAAVGSIFKAGTTIGQGIYEVISNDPVTYNGNIYNKGDRFTFSGPTNFAGPGFVQKIQSIFVGNIYNAGDTLQTGGTYLVEGNAGGTITYDSIVYQVGDIFNYVLNQNTFTVSDSSMFVQQIAEDPQLIISFTDFFKSIRAFMGGNAALGNNVNGDVFLEDLSYIYQSNSTGNKIDLGNVGPDWKSQLAVDLMYANFKVGYNDQQYDSINGNQEVNSLQEYTSSLMLASDTPEPLNLISAVRADPYGIELTRITETDSAASRSDNNTFAVWINPVPVSNVPFTYYHPALAADSLTSITGVDKSYYNFFLSPKHCLLRGAPYLASIFYNMADYPITLASAPKNSAMVTVDLAGVRVAEADSILVSKLGTPLFIPLYYVGKQGISFSILNMLYNNPYQDMSFNINGVTLKAFVYDFKINAATEEPQDIKLLLTGNKSNDLTQLIRL